MMKQLDARGKGEAIYDYAHDILLFKVKGREYDRSVEFENIVLDFDTQGFLTGMQVFDASKVFGTTKYGLKGLRQFEFRSQIEDNVISIQLQFVLLVRNREVIRQNFVRESSDLEDTRVVATTA